MTKEEMVKFIVANIPAKDLPYIANEIKKKHDNLGIKTKILEIKIQ
jgi:hypothetical protein